MRNKKKNKLSKTRVCVYCGSRISKTSRYVVLDNKAKIYAHIRCNRAVYIINDEYHEMIEKENNQETYVMLPSIL